MKGDRTFSHVDEKGNPTMVDVGDKVPTKRTAKAKATVLLTPEIMDHLQGEDIQTKKGPVFQTAITAGIMAVKKTSELIPLCHPLAIENCKVEISPRGLEVDIVCTVRVSGKTGVEMEALTGASIAALTIYDMCKAFSHDLRIIETQLMEKTGGKNDFKRS